MNNSTNQGYSTYYLGLPENITNSLKLMLLNNTGSQITLYNVKKVYISLINSSLNMPYTILTRANTSEPYIISDFDNIGIDSFNTIIYIRGTEPSGFTLFNSSQSVTENKIDNLSIYLDFSVSDGGNIEVEMDNSLYDIRKNNKLPDTLLGLDELYQFPRISDIKDYYLANKTDDYVRYTSLASSLSQDSTISIITDTNFIKSVDSVYSTYIPYQMFISNRENYTNFSIGSCDEEKPMCLYGWSEKTGSYCVTSILGTNRFNNSEPIYSGTIDPSYKIIGFYGSTAKLQKDNKYYLYELPEKIIVEISGCVFFDSMNDKPEPVFYSSGKSLSSLKTSNQEICRILNYVSGINFDLNDDLKITEKKDSWVTFENSELKIYANQNGSLVVNPENKEKIIIVNSRCILQETKCNSIFYFFDNGNQESPTSKDSDYKFTIPKIDGLSNQVLDGFRRRPMSGVEIPDIIDSYGGVLFYIDSNNYLRYL